MLPAGETLWLTTCSMASLAGRVRQHELKAGLITHTFPDMYLYCRVYVHICPIILEQSTMLKYKTPCSAMLF